MGKFYESVSDEQADLIRNSSVFFVASVEPSLRDTSGGAGPVNLSPKGGSPLHLLSRNRVAYLDYPGSGNETARHVQAGAPITIMVMATDQENAAIVRLYGRGRVYKIEDHPEAALFLETPAEHLAKPRQIIEVQIEKTQTSCGYGVPVMTVDRQRTKEGRGRRFKELPKA